MTHTSSPTRYTKGAPISCSPHQTCIELAVLLRGSRHHRCNEELGNRGGGIKDRPRCFHSEV